MGKSKMVICDEFKLVDRTIDVDKRTKFKKSDGLMKSLRTDCLLSRSYVENTNGNSADTGIIYEIDEEKTTKYYEECDAILKQRAQDEETQGALTTVLADSLVQAKKTRKKRTPTQED